VALGTAEVPFTHLEPTPCVAVQSPPRTLTVLDWHPHQSFSPRAGPDPSGLPGLHGQRHPHGQVPRFQGFPTLYFYTKGGRWCPTRGTASKADLIAFIKAQKESATSNASQVRESTVRYRTEQNSPSTVQYITLQFSTVQYSTVKYSTVQYSTVTVQYSRVQYSTGQLPHRVCQGLQGVRHLAGAGLLHAVPLWTRYMKSAAAPHSTVQ